MDISVSHCNRFVLAAGKDARILVWELKSLSFVQELTNHSKQVNNLKLVRIFDRDLMFSCSDDGLVNCYDIGQIRTTEEIKEMRATRHRDERPKAFLYSLDSAEFSHNHKSK